MALLFFLLRRSAGRVSTIHRRRVFCGHVNTSYEFWDLFELPSKWPSCSGDSVPQSGNFTPCTHSGCPVSYSQGAYAVSNVLSPILSSSVWCFTNPSCPDLPEPAPSILKSTQAVRLLLSPRLHPHDPSFCSPTSLFLSPFSSPLFISDKVSLSCPGWPWIPEKKQVPCHSLLRGYSASNSFLLSAPK